MRHTGTLELETDRLLLRRLLSQDAPQMYENWANDPAVTRFLRWEPHKSPAETRELLSAWAELYPNPDYYQWAIVEKATGQVFGSISVYNALLGEPQQKTKWQGLELSGGIWEPGYCIGQKWWGKGFTTEALQAVVDFWFRQVGGAFLTCCHAVQNPASGRVMEKAGFVYHHNDVYHKFDGTPAKAISVFDYTQIVFAALLGILFLNQIPDVLSIAGYIVIIGTAIFKWQYNMKYDT